MERQAGLGRSLGEVIESLTPVEPATAERLQFDVSELLARLDDLLADVRDLRDQVHHLTAIAGDDTASKKAKKKDKKRRKKKSKARND